MNTLTKNRFKDGIVELDRISQLDYRQTIWIVAGEASDTPETKLLRVGRVLGVSMKEPFSKSRKRPRPTTDTRSTRAWTLQPDELANSVAVRGTWQYATLEAMAKEARVSPKAMAQALKRERNFFGFLLDSVRKYVCGDAKIRAKIQKNVEVAHKTGLDVRLLTPEAVVAAGGLALGAYLISVVPILGYVGAPVIAGLVLLLYSIGIDALCAWVASKPKVAA